MQCDIFAQWKSKPQKNFFACAVKAWEIFTSIWGDELLLGCNEV